MKKVSIIIPVHNTEKYLPRCIESCLNQSLLHNEYEIIVIDDCSTDSCPVLIKKYADNYQNIIPIFLSENIRQGGARNRGLQIAKGEYVAFVDSDDWIEPDMCEKLYHAAKTTNSDMAGADIFISKDNFMHHTVKLNYRSGKINNEENLFSYINNCGLFVTRIYRRQFLIENNIFFPENLLYEDAYFNFLTSLYANRVQKLDEAFYHYFQRNNSSSSNKNNIHLYERFDIAELILEDCKNRGLFNKFKNIIEYKYVLMHSSSILHTFLGLFDIPNKEKIKNTAHSVKKKFPKFKHGKYYKNINIHQRFYLNLSFINPTLTIWCYKHNITKYLETLQIIIKKLHFKKNI